MTTEERFWAKVDVRGEDECWPWTAAISTGGYGAFRVNQPRTMRRAHRVAWELEVGPVPDDKWVLHHCDNRLCCNPTHLYLGTVIDNNRDMVERDRFQRGADHWTNRMPEQAFGGRVNAPGRRTLSEEDVLHIRARCAAGESQVRVSRDYPVGTSQISNIVQRRAWAHV